MSLFDAFSRRGDTAEIDLPPQASDAELLAWGDTLSSPKPPRRRTPLRAAPETD